ncbi:MAG: protein translocase subunit SecF, partial [Pseudomonadota bacterium]
MQLLPSNLNINFIAMRFGAAVLSCLLILVCVYSLATSGLNFGIDFLGGTKVELKYESDVSVIEIRQELANNGFSDSVVQHFGSNRDVMIRLPLAEGQADSKASTEIVEIMRNSAMGVGEVLSVEFVGPTFGRELLERGILALVYALIMVMIYVMFRFEWKFSLGSVVALIHDIIITVGIFSLLRLEFTLPVLAALLAVIGYSLNDTIVVFDRIRENFRKLRESDTAATMNVSINQTLPRTILTSLTTLLVLCALYFYGGEALNGFAAT